MKNAIQYKDWLLAPSSKAHQLFTEKKLQELDKHLRECDQAEDKRRGEL